MKPCSTERRLMSIWQVTLLTSGACFTNVKFSNKKLYSYTKGTRNFPTIGPATYYTLIAKPSKMNFSYGSNSETMSINYN